MHSEDVDANAVSIISINTITFICNPKQVILALQWIRLGEKPHKILIAAALETPVDRKDNPREDK